MSEWEPIGKLAPIWKPTKAGESVEGTVFRVYEGTYGTAVDLETKQGRITLPAHSNLVTAMTEMKVGDQVRIKYTGKGSTKKGQQFNKYEVTRKRATASQ
jgi:hypothetical protein